MKIYAEFIEDDGLLFRTKTLLQFGDSWDLIGSIVMKNPGSAKPGVPLNEESKKQISNFLGEKIDFTNWTETSNDPTMKRIAPIFNGNYVQKNIPLNGVIQIFNLYNICEPKMKFVYEKAENANINLLYIDAEQVINQFREKPVYLGFFHFYTYSKTKHSKYLKNTAQTIYDYVKQSIFNYFEKDDMIDNPYYHPFSKYVYSQKNIPLLEKFSTFYE